MIFVKVPSQVPNPLVRFRADITRKRSAKRVNHDVLLQFRGPFRPIMTRWALQLIRGFRLAQAPQARQVSLKRQFAATVLQIVRILDHEIFMVHPEMPIQLVHGQKRILTHGTCDRVHVFFSMLSFVLRDDFVIRFPDAVHFRKLLLLLLIGRLDFLDTQIECFLLLEGFDIVFGLHDVAGLIIGLIEILVQFLKLNQISIRIKDLEKRTEKRDQCGMRKEIFL